MKSIEFLKEKLQEVFMSCPYLEIRYEYRDYINTHIIDIRPPHCFDSDRDYINKQILLEDEFENLFPNEEVLFMTENELISITNPILEIGVCDVVAHEIIPQPIICQSSYELNYVGEYSNNKIEFYIPPPKKWWSSGSKNKKDSHNHASLFLFNFVLWQKQKKQHLVL